MGGLWNISVVDLSFCEIKIVAEESFLPAEFHKDGVGFDFFLCVLYF